MNMFWTLSISLLFYRSLAEGVLVVEKEEDPEFIMQTIYSNLDLEDWNPIDYRCYQKAYSRFNFTDDDFYKVYVSIETKGCRYKRRTQNGKLLFYPPLTALDPAMPVYIDFIHEGIVRLATSAEIPLDVPSKIRRGRRYCIEMRRIASTFVDYIELFHSDDETCWLQKLKEIVKECAKFRHASSLWAGPVYDRFCLGEDGCYTTMELYEDEMPHCVKYIAKSQFQNVSFGSWHHSIINYCQLTDMVPEAKDTNYDRSILYEDDKTEDDLLTMCQFLRFRLLPEEGKEEEIREIILEERDNSDTEIERNSAAFYLSTNSYLIIIAIIDVLKNIK